MSTNPNALQYGRDLPELKEQIVALMARRGVTCTADQISITAGGQHAMNLLTRLFLNPHGQVMLEELVYTGVQQVIMPFEPEIITIPIDAETGLDLEAIVAHLEAGARPAFLYTIPSAHNPLGITLSREKQAGLVQIARRYQLPLIEDDAYGFLNYDTESNPSLRAFDEDWAIYIGTFAKIIAPGLRLGWIVSPAALAPKIQVMKRVSMLSVLPLSQHIVSTYLGANDFSAHIDHLRQEYGRRRDAMLQAMQQQFPPEVQWARPGGGLFIWARLPAGLNATEVVEQAVAEEGVAFIPGNAFAAIDGDGRYNNYMRLSYAKYAPERIEEGIARLGRLLKRIISQSTLARA